MSSARSLVALAFAVIMVLGVGTAEASPVKHWPTVVLKSTPVGIRCSVGRDELVCSGVVAYLRDTLKLKPGHLVVVKGVAAVERDASLAILDSLKAAGFSVDTTALVSY